MGIAEYGSDVEIEGAERALGPGRPRLVDRVERIGRLAPEEVLDRFLAWIDELGLEPYPAQEQALLEIASGRHVILNTPTGSGKSLVAVGLHFQAMCEGARSFYTSPIKALVSEKFFALCEDFGPENVGMLTGDASINPAAPIVCCTAEVLANMALRQGEALRAPYVVMDEFHYYADPARGMAWQIPLLVLPHTRFLLMSATLGDMTQIRLDLERRTGRAVALVDSAERPVPLDFEYRETLLHETVEYLLETRRAPIYIVSFTQREAADLAQSLTSLDVCSREDRQRIAEALGDFPFDTQYGKVMQRFVRAGIGVHHAGLLPRYRLLVEQLAQQGLLRVVSGTDTLGVGVNIPIRTVLFTKLAKFDGKRVGLLSVREFKQIAGRAGRKGFDERGSVVCQAPEHVIEALRRKKKSEGKRGGKVSRGAPRRPAKGEVTWSHETFDRLIHRPPEALVSRFAVTHGMVVNLLRREEESKDPSRGYRALIELIDASHEPDRRKRGLRRDSARLVRGLRRAGIVCVVRDEASGRRRLVVSGELQWDFSLHHTLSIYLIEAISCLDRNASDYALVVLSLVEAVLEDPRAILFAQVNVAKRELMAKLKAEGVPFEERIRLLDDVTPPQPDLETIHSTFAFFVEKHPWVRDEDLRPKSIVREIYEGYYSFDHYVRFYQLQRVEGLLLRYLSQVYTTLDQSVPEAAKTDELWEMQAFLRAMIERVDSSLVQEWEHLLHPERRRGGRVAEERPKYDLARDERGLRARIRAEAHRLVRALADADYEEAARCVRADPEDSWDPERFAAALAPFHADHERIVFGERARHSEFTRIERTGERRWRVTQTLLDPADENFWYFRADIDLRTELEPVGPILRLEQIGS